MSKGTMTEPRPCWVCGEMSDELGLGDDWRHCPGCAAKRRNVWRRRWEMCVASHDVAKRFAEGRGMRLEPHAENSYRLSDESARIAWLLHPKPDKATPRITPQHGWRMIQLNIRARWTLLEAVEAAVRARDAVETQPEEVTVGQEA